jgi:serine/threonine protein kinase
MAETAVAHLVFVCSTAVSAVVGRFAEQTLNRHGVFAMPVDPKLAQRIFLTALEAASPADRAALLERDCSDDAKLRGRVEALLRAHDESDGPVDRPAADAPVETTDDHPYPSDEGVGAVLAGRYKLLEAIGEGGMGAVFMAQQTEPVRRLVAVKLIKAGMDSKQVLARFEAERQALALMDHPNIAKVLDAGATDAGRPFFVMELVKGVPITKFCDQRKLTTRQRLELFVPVCQAIQHAHQKGIIHRDIKPSNVLVALYDDRPVPKVIDFGVAKAAGPQLTEHTLATGFGAVIGTPEYMSPEQASLNALDVDTRSDVYALGVLLYELLTGTTPLDRKRLGRAAMMEMLRLVREEETPKPSARLSTSEALPSIAANRQTEPAKLSRLMRGELDWVVLKALEKDRARRYETANGLARDVGRYLADEVVEARPPSVGYRLRKFVKRNKSRVIAAAAVLLALVGGVVGTSLGLVRALEAESKALASADAERKAKEAEVEQRAAAEAATATALASADAERRAKEAEGKAKDAAERRLAQVEKGIDILGSVFKDLNPDTPEKEGKPWQAVLGERLDQATAQLDGEAVGDPLAVAKLQMTLGESQLGLGYAEKAIALFKRALETYTARLGPDHPNTLNSMDNLATAYQAAGKLDLALPLFVEALKLTKAKLGPDHPDTLTSLNNLAGAYQDAGKLDLALPLFVETLKLTKAKLGPDHPDTLGSMNNLATAYQAAGKLDLALPLQEETLKLMKAKLGPDHPNTLRSMGNLALAYQHAGKFDLALPLLEETLKHMKAKLGPDHPDTLGSMNNLAQAYQAAGKLDLALPLQEETLKLMKAKLGPDHPNTLRGMHNLAVAYWRAGKLDRSIPLFEETLKLQKAKLGLDHPNTLVTQANLGANYWDAGRLDDAIPLLADALDRATKRPGPFPAQLAGLASSLADAYDRAGRFAQSEPLYRKAVDGTAKQFGADDPRTAAATAALGLNLLHQHKDEEAEPLLRACLAVRQKKAPDAWTTFNTQSLLGDSLLGQKKYEEAEPLLLAGYEGMEKRAKKIPPSDKVCLSEAAERLARLYDALDQPDKADAWREKEKAAKAAANPANKPSPSRGGEKSP